MKSCAAAVTSTYTSSVAMLPPKKEPRAELSARDDVQAIRYLFATGLIALTLAAAVLLRATLKLPDLEMLFLLTVMVTAISFGLRTITFGSVSWGCRLRLLLRPSLPHV